ncbi:MAG: hypothetical protein JOZ80_04760 [Acidobacteriaceae bacterium]|nr:hypothetical protein [Acidobacteriaceae bacterium]
MVFSQFTSAIVLALGMMSAGFAQGPPSQVPQLPNPAPPNSPSDNPARDRMEREMAKKANEERQAQLKRDSDRLFKLATELKESVDKSNQNTLSIDVVKKAEEIEKLAHSVKEKMKGN